MWELKQVFRTQPSTFLSPLKKGLGWVLKASFQFLFCFTKDLSSSPADYQFQAEESLWSPFSFLRQCSIGHDWWVHFSSYFNAIGLITWILHKLVDSGCILTLSCIFYLVLNLNHYLWCKLSIINDCFKLLLQMSKTQRKLLSCQEVKKYLFDLDWIRTYNSRILIPNALQLSYEARGEMDLGTLDGNSRQ